MLHQSAKLFLEEKEICDCFVTKIVAIKNKGAEAVQSHLLTIECLTSNEEGDLVTGVDYRLVLQQDSIEYKVSSKVIYEAVDDLVTSVLAMTDDEIEFNKRKNERYDTNLSGYMEANSRMYPIIISDVSDEGLAIMTLRNLNHGDEIKCHVYDERHKILRLNAEVKRKNFSTGLTPKVFQYGLQVKDLKDEEKEILNDIIEKIK